MDEKSEEFQFLQFFFLLKMQKFLFQRKASRVVDVDDDRIDIIDDNDSVDINDDNDSVDDDINVIDDSVSNDIDVDELFKEKYPR